MNKTLYIVKGNIEKSASTTLVRDFYSTLESIGTELGYSVCFIESDITEDDFKTKIRDRTLDDKFILFSRGDRFCDYLVDTIRLDTDQIVLIGALSKYSNKGILFLRHPDDWTYLGMYSESNLNNHWSLNEFMKQKIRIFLRIQLKITRMHNPTNRC